MRSEERSTSLGFGCGSVLGRVGRADSLRAMGAAWDAGITLFDTARSYGFGNAEAVLGEFLRGRREQAVIATKYGIAAQKPSALKRAAVPMVRAAMRVPGVRGVLHRGAEHVEHERGEFSAKGLRAAVEDSLRQLQTDRLDVLFLHEAGAKVTEQQELLAELEALVQSGKVLHVGLYATAKVAAVGLEHGPAVLSAMQFGASVFDATLQRVAKNNSRRAILIGNHPFGGKQRLAKVREVLAAMGADHSVDGVLREKLHAGDWPMLTEAILGMVLESTDAVVFSMMQPEHIRANVNAVDATRFTSAELALMRERMIAARA